MHYLFFYDKIIENNRFFRIESELTEINRNASNIKKNVQFFFWVTIISTLLTIIFAVMTR